MVRHPRLAGIPAQVGAREMTKEIGINQLKRRDFLKAGLVFGAGAAGLAGGDGGAPADLGGAGYPDKKNRAAHENRMDGIHLARRDRGPRRGGSPAAPEQYQQSPTRV